MAGIDEGKSEARLESWKEIAAFFDRDEKTVRRWEKELRLPVHRLPGVSKGRVYAFPDELTEWAERPRESKAEIRADSARPLNRAPFAKTVSIPPSQVPAQALQARRAFYVAAPIGLLLLAVFGFARTSPGLRDRGFSIAQRLGLFRKAPVRTLRSMFPTRKRRDFIWKGAITGTSGQRLASIMRSTISPRPLWLIRSVRKRTPVWRTPII